MTVDDEEDRLAPYACRPSESRGRLVAEPESPTRSVHQRDRDRIIHSGAFRKLEYKTQVFVVHVGDYYRTRLTHSLEVAQITRSICRSLRLNEDLAEALALAHDLGHTPFGHAGEDALNHEMAPWGGFQHNDQTLRVLTRLEQRYAAFDGLNLTWETLEGVIKHNGPLTDAAGTIALPPSIAAFQSEWDLEPAGHPALEAQVAALADDIAYMNHDIDDGLRADLFPLGDLQDLPLVGEIVGEIRARHPGLEGRRLIHELVRRLIDRMVGDLVAETGRRLAALKPENAAAIRGADRPMVAFSPALHEQLKAVRAFLFARMYRHYRVNRETSKARRVVRALFRLFMAEPNTLPTHWQAGAVDGSPESRARIVADYIAGMTDRYAVLEYRRLFEIRADM
ncbi:MAG: deoxyguanosinetriphosphate triphosphohydrolase [Alphaproteobacteria bacterium]|jgi:dGTPase|nr:deoxyguanosinetriphosphate triphosphohydrolase [Alphaproteobacteria bacterium]